MLIFSIEQSKATYFADFVVYALAIAGLSVYLAIGAPPGQRAALLLWVVTGLAVWTWIEYVVHRFVLHHVPPFKAMHEMHHRNPRAFIGTPTIVTAALFALLVFAPAWWTAGNWVACALTLGVLLGYEGYSFMHHGLHHWRGRSEWFTRRKHMHGMHHQFGPPGYYGVTTSFWDHVFRSARAARTPGLVKVK